MGRIGRNGREHLRGSQEARVVNGIRSLATPEVVAAFRAYEEQERQHNTKVGCLLVMTLMPLGIPMDYYVYREHFWLFLQLRVWSAIIAMGIWLMLNTRAGIRISRVLSTVIPLVPVFFIDWMIAVSDGFLSPYYAGLNLVLLAVGAVLRWTFRESLFAVSLVFVVYVATGLWHGGPVNTGTLASNFFFLSCMDIIVVVGTYFQYRARFREFLLRYELDRNKRMLETSNQKLMELDQAKSRFFANISHELRTPLTLLIAPLETLLRKFNLDAESKSLLSTMHANGMRLLKLINDLLDLVRLESGPMQVKPEPVDLPELIQGLASAVRHLANDKRLRLETVMDPGLGAVVIDRDKLEKVLLNLVFNALKFTPSGGLVSITSKLQDGHIHIAVSDTGMGISKKNLPFVFDRFWQADDSANRKYQGVGIGLALVKELVAIQGGSVDVQSEEGKGTTFTIRLPYQKADAVPSFQPPPQPDTGPSANASSDEWLAGLYRRAELFPGVPSVQDSIRPADGSRNGHQARVLVADDEPDMLRFLTSQLRNHYQVLEAVDGEQAVQKAKQFLPDLILLDMMMPEKDGLQACREIRAHTPAQTIPIVLLTARADEETKLAALSAGASDFLAKPFSTTELHIRLKNLVESHSYQRKLSKQNQLLESTIEQLKATETQLVQSEKLASLGRLSAGIIHEINNPLNFATTGLFTLRNKRQFVAPEKQEEYAEIVSEIEEGITRVKNIVTDLRTFTRSDSESREPVEVAEVVSAALRFLAHELKEIVVEQKLTPHQTITSNKNKLIQVLINLVQNSVDALATKQFVDEKPTISIEGRIERDKNILLVRDNGMGISQEHLDKIFDPFFTTKDVGKGMGLGLSICYRIVQQSGGRILVRTEPGKYCEFALEFSLEE